MPFLGLLLSARVLPLFVGCLTSLLSGMAIVRATEAVQVPISRCLALLVSNSLSLGVILFGLCTARAFGLMHLAPGALITNARCKNARPPRHMLVRMLLAVGIGGFCGLVSYFAMPSVSDSFMIIWDAPTRVDLLIVSPLVEELAFRWSLWRLGWKWEVRDWITATLTCITFWTAHVSVHYDHNLDVLFGGACLSIVRLRMGLRYSVLAHVSWNVTGHFCLFDF